MAGDAALPERALAALARAGLAPRAVALVVAAERDAAAPEIHALARQLDRPLRLVAASTGAAALAAVAVPTPVAGAPKDPGDDGAVALAVAAAPIDPTTVGRARGRLAVVGLGPGAPGWLAPEARAALADADDIVGYQTYVALAGPFRGDQTLHVSDNREELLRARQALALAARGRSVAVVSSGDPGIFAMAAAVMEALDGNEDPAWHGVALSVVPGISAAQAAAARAGAPLGHDFCVLSLSDNLKPWAVIERRLALAASGDFVLALYNPASQARPHQLGRALEIIREHRGPQTPVVIGRDVGRADESVRIVPLGELSIDGIDMRTVLIVGASTTRTLARADGGLWAYTPRSYDGDGRA